MASLFSSDELRAIFEHSIDAIAVFRGPLHLSVNPAYMKLFGYKDVKELIGTPIQDRIAPDELPRIQDFARRRAAGEDVPSRYETRGRRRNGEEFDMMFSVSTYTRRKNPLRKKLSDLSNMLRIKKVPNFLPEAWYRELEEEIFTIIILRDITEQKRLAREARETEILRAKLEKEKELIVLRDRIITTVSHEFRTPLTIIQTSSDLLKNYRARMTEEKMNSYHDQIFAQIKHMTNLLSDALSISQLEAGKTVFNPEDILFEPLCCTILEDFEVIEAPGREFMFKSHVQDTSLKADKNLLKYVIIHLLSNAVKYSDKDSPIEVTINEDPDYLILEVVDGGIGIPEKDLPEMFEPFHRASNVNTIQGTGMGLNIVKRYIELHHGHIEVESNVGEGTKFTVKLPRT